MTYPLSTLAPTVSSSGISAPSYQDIFESLKASFQTIYGGDAYIEADSQDGQLLAIVAQAVHDSNQNTIAVYNSFRPSGATGEGLSSIVKINGIARLVPTNSTVDVTVTGQAGTTITGGIVADVNGNKWDLPASVVIPVSGEITVTATAQQQGAIAAPAATVTTIYTPTRGWQSVTNPSAATAGAPVESDAALRRRQALSVALPAQSIMGALIGGVSGVTGVTDLAIYENDTNVTDANGIPGHSIAVVVSGGTDAAIADEIMLRKTPGCGTYGTTTVVATDSQGVTSAIKFSRPTQVPVTVAINIKPLTGYVDSVGDLAVQSIIDYIVGLPIGDDVFLSQIFRVAQEAGATFAINSVTMKRGANPLAAANVTIAYNEIATADSSSVTLTVTP